MRYKYKVLYLPSLLTTGGASRLLSFSNFSYLAITSPESANLCITTISILQKFTCFSQYYFGDSQATIISAEIFNYVVSSSAEVR